MQSVLQCPACGSVLSAVLASDVTPVQCECGQVFFAQRPDLEGRVLDKPQRKKKDATAGAAATGGPRKKLSLKLLQKGDDETSAAVIAAFGHSATFKAFAKREMQGILARDNEDDQKLAEGITMAIAKGAVPSDVPIEPLRKIDVLGKSADAVADEIITALGDAPKRGCVLVLQGLSGTGKGTTVAKLQSKLPNASTWSNGNVFRALTLLAVNHCEKHGLAFSADALTPQLLRELVGCLHFERKPSKAAAAAPEFDVRIEGPGLKCLVSEVQNTLLKDAKVSKNIPTVARVTQGEVISFAARCAATMRDAGCNVLMEGRAQTLNYVRTEHRFELTLSKPLTIGMRRAAQRMVGSATPALETFASAKRAKVQARASDLSEGDVLAALEASLQTLAK